MPPHDNVRFPHSGDFYAELKRRVATHFATSGEAQRDHPAMYVKTAVILIWMFGSYLALMFWATTPLEVVVLALSEGLAMAGLGFNIQHDGNHGGYSDRPAINRVMAYTLDLIGGSSYVWRWKHNVIHHTYTNIAHVDADTDVGDFARLTPNHRRRAAHRYQHLYIWVLYGLLPFKWIFFDDFYNLATSRIGTQRFPKPSWGTLALTLGMKAFYAFWAIALPLWLHPVAGVALAYGVAALILGATLSIVFQSAHCLEQAEFPIPDSNQSMDNSWAIHQVETTVDFAPKKRALTWFLGGLNFQVEHHLFPGICHLNYPVISKIVASTCADYGIQYRMHPTFLGAIRAHVRWLYLMGYADPVTPRLA